MAPLTAAETDPLPLALAATTTDKVAVLSFAKLPIVQRLEVLSKLPELDDALLTRKVLLGESATATALAASGPMLRTVYVNVEVA